MAVRIGSLVLSHTEDTVIVYRVADEARSEQEEPVPASLFHPASSPRVLLPDVGDVRINRPTRRRCSFSEFVRAHVAVRTQFCICLWSLLQMMTVILILMLMQGAAGQRRCQFVFAWWFQTRIRVHVPS